MHPNKLKLILSLVQGGGVVLGVGGLGVGEGYPFHKTNAHRYGALISQLRVAKHMLLLKVVSVQCVENWTSCWFNQQWTVHVHFVQYPLLQNEQGGSCIRKLKRNMFKETGSKVEHVLWRPIQLIWNFLHLSWWFGRRLLLLKHLLFPKFVPRAATEFHSGLSSFLYHWSIF